MSEWIEWKGGKCPVGQNQHVVARLRVGRELPLKRAAELYWHLDGGVGDIVAYRVVRTPAEAVSEIFTEPTPQTAPSILAKAAALMAERGKQYDKPEGERSMGRAVAALNAVLGRPALTESEGWLLLQLLKDVRDRQRDQPHVDSLEDGVAYAALKAEARLQEKGGVK